MSFPASVRRSLYIVAAFVLCALFVPRPATADQIYSVTFTGTGTCASGTCNGSTVTGTYFWDVTTNSPASSGTWSFDTPIGDFSGVGGYPAEPSGEVIGDQSGFNLLDFIAGNGTAGIQLGFSGATSFDGSVVPTDDLGNLLSLVINLPNVTNSFDITSGTAIGSLVSTPEPSALLLLAVGLFGLFIIRRRHSGAQPRSAQS